MNRDHKSVCLCFQCLDIGDSVLVYVSCTGGFSEEIVTKITGVDFNDDREPYAVLWPNAGAGPDGRGGEPNNWWIRSNPNAPKDILVGSGKIIRRVK